MKCLNPRCGEDVRDSERLCPICQHDCGYPNVRAAQNPGEVRALGDRLGKAELVAANRGLGTVMTGFRSAVRRSEAVLCRPLGIVMNLVSTDNELHATFYDLVGVGARRPEDTPIELQRQIADDILFPYYRNEIRFAALSINGEGITRYGTCSLVLREALIEERTTVFEENSLYFGVRKNLGLRKPVVPLGFRTTWARRDELAAAKLQSALHAGAGLADFAGILLTLGKGPEDDDFVEVHIYGPLHRRNIARLTIRGAKRRAERGIIKQLEVTLTSIGARVEIKV